MRDGEVWWVLKDVCDVLGLSQPHRVATRLDEDDRTLMTVIDAVGRNQDTTIINESGLYTVILRSDKPEAKNFKRWVTHEVLPSIRKHGAYVTPEKMDEMMSNPEAWIKLLTALRDERAEKERLQSEVTRVAPLVEFAETVGESPDTIDVGDLAMLVQDAGLRIGRNRLFQWLRQNKMLRPNNKPYQSYVNQGWFDLIETTKKSGARSSLFVKTVVTGKGQLAIVERLRREVAA
jgi:anti-repressor protein